MVLGISSVTHWLPKEDRQTWGWGWKDDPEEVAKKDLNHESGQQASIGRCPSTVRPVFLVLVFQLSKQQNRTRTTPSTVLETPPNRTRTKKLPLEEL